ncbi:WXG100 family type VII secretion target [Kitasatospora sp. NPDC088391]|uniref:WXG100 family type VII secretion target n=1 Tax=Kitasatospora sp. NPDC088391 TaxID=3364074 RepID=UPI0038251D7E
MGEQIVVRSWELHGEGREFESVSNDFGGAAKQLESGLAALGAPWGSDAPGQPFGASYGEAREGVLAGLQGLAERLGRIGAGLHTMADNTVRTDQDISADFNAPSLNHPAGPGRA